MTRLIFTWRTFTSLNENGKCTIINTDVGLQHSKYRKCIAQRRFCNMFTTVKSMIHYKTE